jgi:hypothetical protein
MPQIADRASARNRFSQAIIPFPRPRIERAFDCGGWLVLRGSHGWLHGDRRAAVADLDEISRIEGTGRGRR